MDKDKKTIYDLNLHEELQADLIQVMRVPGGWIYRFWDYSTKDYYAYATFVPYSEEFQTRKPGQCRNLGGLDS